MSANSFNTPLFLAIKPSIQKSWVVLAPHALALVLVASVSVFSLLIKFIIIALILISAITFYRLHLKQNLKKSVISIQQDSAKNWFLTTYDKGQDNNVKSVILLPSSFISKMLIVLNYRDDSGSYYSVMLTPNCISSNEFRRLRVRVNIINIKKS